MPLVVLLLCAGVLLGLRWWRAGKANPAVLVTRFPASVNTVLYLDVAALNASGVLTRLAGQSGSQEGEYLRFVEEIAFDFQRDLRSVMLGFSQDNTYALASGVFDWDVLRNYAQSRNGTCRFSICRMPAYSNNRAISWAPYYKNLMAISIGPDQWGAAELTSGPGQARPSGPPDSPVWLSSSGAALRNAGALPAGTRLFTRVLEPADRILFAIRQNAAAELEIALSAECKAPEVAARVARELAELTATVNTAIERENRKPNPADLSGVLCSGKFRAEARVVTGSWPLPKSFMETLLASNP